VRFTDAIRSTADRDRNGERIVITTIPAEVGTYMCYRRERNLGRNPWDQDKPTEPVKKLKAAVVLCGSGRGDGSEIHESVSVLVHLSRLGFAYECFAPDRPQRDVVNHATGEVVPDEKRSCMVEAARISRGQITPLSKLKATGFDALVIPGGFGAAKNLCTFAADGPRCTVDPDVERVIREFHAARKPIGLCCIAPVIAAKVLGRTAGGPGVNVTLGPHGPASKAVTEWGSGALVCPVDVALVDPEQRVVTTPAYMYDHATPAEVFTGIGEMIEHVVDLVRTSQSTVQPMGQPTDQGRNDAPMPR
jgi:enhancing lycopene biosynthesis protein 2